MSCKACLNCFSPLTGGPVCPQCGFDNAAYVPKPHHLPVGTVLQNRYVVGRAMGHGGFGITYVGFDANLDFKVAIKEYFPDGTAMRDASQTTAVSCQPSENAQDRYDTGLRKSMNEARALAKLGAIPSIVRVQDFFQANNTAYIIMEFLEGVTLNAHLRSLPERPGYREALALLSPIGAALEKIHAKGFVHRDISPDNIMIDREGAVKLLDFGAVKTVTEGGSVTENPVVKRGFSPAEMYSTDGLIGPWSDVYAYCATLYYILTGKPVPEPMNRLQNDTLGDSLSRIVSPAQTAALLKGLAIPPRQRYQTVTEMTTALKACADEPALEPEPSAIPETMVLEKPGPQEPTPPPLPKQPDDSKQPEANATKHQKTTAKENALFSSVNIGDYIKFGTYQQSNTPNTKEPIEWLVLAKEDGKALLLSRYGLDRQQYNEYLSLDSVTWETCTLRTWLNGKFLNSAFSFGEQGRIISGTVTADKNPEYDTDPGNDTIDKIFLLSIPEAEKYFSADEERKCQPTAYAKAHGVWTNDTTGCCWWWLRSPGGVSYNAAYVDFDGGVYRFGYFVNYSASSVRPALWIDLTA